MSSLPIIIGIVIIIFFWLGFVLEAQIFTICRIKRDIKYGVPFREAARYWLRLNKESLKNGWPMGILRIKWQTITKNNLINKK